jgi:glutathionylspermidine synthase
MKRHIITPRFNWEEKVQEQGFLFYKNYYFEDACYEFTAAEIDKIEEATATIYDMCLAVVQHVIDNDLWDEFFIPEEYAELIKWSWNTEQPSLYGRFDLAYNGTDIKLLEFNADTPTLLIEAGVIQWYWLQEYNASLDQFNSIHEKLVDSFAECKPLFEDNKLHFTCLSTDAEDFMTTKYIEETARQAGLNTEFLTLESLAVDGQNQFVTDNGELIKNIFKLYPYEWMFAEEFGTHLVTNKDICKWIEPAYKAILSNKMMLKYIYELFPESPYILPCSYGTPITQSYARKPVFSREGANVSIIKEGVIVEQHEGDYGEEGYLYQQYTELPEFDGYKPILGSWIIGGEPAGMGIRESSNLVTNAMSRFCPHYFK